MHFIDKIIASMCHLLPRNFRRKLYCTQHDPFKPRSISEVIYVRLL